MIFGNVILAALLSFVFPPGPIRSWAQGRNFWEDIGGAAPPMIEKGYFIGKFFGSSYISRGILNSFIYIYICSQGQSFWRVEGVQQTRNDFIRAILLAPCLLCG